MPAPNHFDLRHLALAIKDAHAAGELGAQAEPPAYGLFSSDALASLRNLQDAHDRWAKERVCGFEPSVHEAAFLMTLNHALEV